MKTLSTFILIVALSLIGAVQGHAEKPDKAKGKGKARPAAQAHAVKAAPMHKMGHASRPANQGFKPAKVAHTQHGANRVANVNAPRNMAVSHNAKRDAQALKRNNQRRSEQAFVAQQQNAALTRHQVREARQARVKTPEIQTRAQNFQGRSYHQVLNNYSRVHHDRSYWTNHYDRIAVVNGGHYYWNNGYWYPAWGFDVGLNNYVYDVPIYGYNGLPPDRVVINVQAELARLGYYDGPQDGLFGPITRGAIRDFQTDYGLPVTASVDEQTLYALGLT